MRHSLIVKNYSLADLFDWFEQISQAAFSFDSYVYQIWIKQSQQPIGGPQTSQKFVDVWCTYPMAIIELSAVRDGVELTITSQDPDVLAEQLPTKYQDIWTDFVTGLEQRLVQEPAPGPDLTAELAGQDSQSFTSALGKSVNMNDRRARKILTRRVTVALALNDMLQTTDPWQNQREFYDQLCLTGQYTASEAGDSFDYKTFTRDIQAIENYAASLIVDQFWFEFRTRKNK